MIGLTTGRRRKRDNEFVHYPSFAASLQKAMPITATCGDLKIFLGVYFAYSPALKSEMLAAIEDLSDDAEWFQGLYRICDLLKSKNERFDSGLFCEWATEEL